MKAALGCAVCSNTSKDEWFVQLRVPPEAALFDPVTLSGCFGIGREETIEKARVFAGVDEVVPWTTMLGERHFPRPGLVQQDTGKAKRRAGLIAELAKLEAACDNLREEISKHYEQETQYALQI